ncbi:MAG TPA: BamA/TamA family outer membrane protein [Nitrospirota bacterium]|nr:BamA/TamA family outer membrane protein [Nitrospirota bacterium]
MIKRSLNIVVGVIACLSAAILLLAAPWAEAATATETGVDKRQSAAAAAAEPSQFYSQDGWLDFSGFLDEAYGFVPIASPITEPAVGYGLAGGLIFVDRNKENAEAGHWRPNLTAVGGLGTENGTWGAFAADSRYWMNDQLHTLAGAITASVNLDFYGTGKNDVVRDRPLSYNLKPRGGFLQGQYRIADSRVWAGLGYVAAVTDVSFEAAPGDSRLPQFQNVSHVGGALVSLTFDSRDNIFTPLKGAYLDASAGLFSPALGSDHAFQRVTLTAMQFLALHPELSFGVRAGGTMSSGDVPFYLRPYVQLRGVQAIRYQGDDVAQIEAELRWQFWKRFSIVGFGGWGAAWNDFTRVDNRITVTSGGVGFRYELASRYGLHMGIDVAWGPDNPIVYVQFGSAWARP